MSTLKIYWQHKLCQLKWKFTKGKSSLRKPRTWWVLYAVMLFYFLGRSLVSGEQYWLVAAIVVFFIFSVFTFWIDYSSGGHIGWHRKQMRITAGKVQNGKKDQDQKGQDELHPSNEDIA